MSIKVTDPNNEGQEMEVFTPEEVAAKAAEIETAKNVEIEAKNKEIETLKRVSAEKTDNFKKLNEMTEEERGKMTAAQIEDRKRIETAESEVRRMKEERDADTQMRIKNDTEAALSKFHGGDEKLKEALEKNFKIINLEGNDTATIQERARMAAAMEAGKTGRANPLMAPMNGSAPTIRDKGRTEKFLESDKGKAALKMMGEEGK